MNPLNSVLFIVSIASASGIFFEMPADKATSTRKEGSGEDFMGGLKQYLGYTDPDTDTNNSSLNKTAAPHSGESTSLYDEVDTALEQATDTVDNLWQEFKKGLFSLMGSFSAGDEDSDGHIAPTPTPTPAQQQTKPIANETSVPVTEPTPVAVASATTPTTTTAGTIIATTTEGKTTELTKGTTASTVEGTTIAPPIAAP